MLTRATHDCRTTFAGGINPFIPAGAVRLMPAYEPASRVAGVFCVTQNDILVVLRDGKERRICEVADATGGDSNNVGKTLAKMATAGLIKREMRRVPGRKPVPFYSIWGTE